ncbi:uncharacterized protein LOC115692951 [Syzygium oleosum]|uniref:uncharacterized protein LOC115692951 n=1 Tax=Syzygium oleosum TaxID=219896 RepID=UPI0011D23B12|nr:uncharacterized protein LOC115692951 [Syzygium oleosum]
MNLLQDPPFLSQILSRSWSQEAFVSLAFEVCKWSAIFLATLACFGTLICRVVKLPALRFPKSSPLAAQQPLASDFDDSDDDTCSSSSEEDDGQSDEDELPSPSGDHSQGNFIFRLAGSGDSQLRRRRSFADNLSQFVLGKTVVKLWDRSDSRLLRLQDANGEFVGRFCQVLASPRSPVAVVSAGLNNLGKIALDVWDTRVGFRIPAIVAEWEPRAGGEVTVGDLRNVISPVEDSLGADAERWWDADAIVAPDEL